MDIHTGLRKRVLPDAGFLGELQQRGNSLFWLAFEERSAQKMLELAME